MLLHFAGGIIRVAFIDANNNTPVLDIKPHTPNFNRVETPGVPAWSSGWPKSTETSGYFDRGQIFNFKTAALRNQSRRSIFIILRNINKSPALQGL